MDIHITPLGARTLCLEAHTGQFRKDGKTPYSEHPIAVAAMLETDEEKILGFLHDVIEDTSAELFIEQSETSYIMFKDKAYYLPTELALDLFYMTKLHKDTPYIVYLEYLAGRPRAVKAKFADIFCNMADAPTQKQKDKYRGAMTLLLKTL